MPAHWAGESAPSANATSRGASGGCCRTTCGVPGTAATDGADSTPTVVSHATPPRKPTTTSGTTRVAPAGEWAAYETEPKAIGPVPGRSTSSRTTAFSTSPDHQDSSSDIRFGPDVVWLAARPQPTTPSPRRTQEHTSRAAARGTRARRAAPSSGSSGTVRETRGAAEAIESVGRSPTGNEVIAHEDTTPRGSGPEAPGARMAAMSRASLDKDPRDVAAMFDDVATRYDVTNDVLSLGRDRFWRRAVVAACEATPGQVVLDIAAGTGTSSEPFADSGVDVVPADFSLGMLRVGRRRRPDLGFTAADAMRLPFADGSFDVVTMSFGLRNVSDPDAALREFLRVTRPGGRLVLCEFSQPTVPAVPPAVHATTS